ncbi:MAG: GNAT family N-acetyltransferase [Chitinophagaceae bacterium]
MNQPFEASITKATNNHRQELTRLLQTAKLPAADLPASLDNFFVVTDKGNLVAAVGLEFYADCGLLRSMVVAEAYRNNHIASQLLLQSEAFAKTSGIDCLYLFTETAAVFFESKGFQK